MRPAGWRPATARATCRLRGVAAEAGFAPAALYGYFQNKDELLLALAAEDLTRLARAMKGTGRPGRRGRRGAGTAAAAPRPWRRLRPR